MELPAHKTRIVCTIGPVSDTPEVMEALLRAGMDVARLNFSHGDFATHGRTIGRLREAAVRTGRRLAIMADLPGPKMRIGEIGGEPVDLHIGDRFTLTVEDIVGDSSRVSVSLKRLPQVVRPGDKLFLNDGLISLRVDRVTASEVQCEVRAGGELRSRKGINLPGIDLGFGAFTAHDRDCLEFALANGVDAVSQSFVSNADDIHAVREAAASAGYRPFVIAKIERARALENLDAILRAADGAMVARGDLGVEIPIARIALVQKELMRMANRLGKPVITATQMLESMTEHRRPTRAEATDVANAVLDGTDAVMLSAESAMGRYPVEAVAMLAAIAAATEPQRLPGISEQRVEGAVAVEDLMAHSVQQAVARLRPAAVVVPTRSGAMARNVTHFRLPLWITAFSHDMATCQALQFSYGVQPVKVERECDDWMPFTRAWFHAQGVHEGLAVLTQGPSLENPHGSHRMEIMDLAPS